MKDYRQINPQLSGMSRKQLEKTYKQYAGNINKRIRNINKSGRYGSILDKRKKIINNLLTQKGNVSLSIKNKNDVQLKNAILDMGYFLSLKTTSLSGLKKQEKQQRDYFLNESGLDIGEDNIDLFMDFLESEVYKELEEEYSSDIIFEEFVAAEKKGVSLKQLENAFKNWKESESYISLDDILKGMTKIEDN
jgi:hypothetical protein